MTYPNQRVVKMKKGKKTGTAVYTAFKGVWEPRGWKLVDDAPVGVTGTIKDTGNEVSTTEKKEEGK